MGDAPSRRVVLSSQSISQSRPSASDDDRRYELEERLDRILDAVDYYGPSPKAEPEDQVAVPLTYREVAELRSLFTVEIHRDLAASRAAYLEDRWRRLEEALAATSNPREVLRAFGLGGAARSRSALHRKLRMAEHYWLLTNSEQLVESPEREDYLDRASRTFGSRPFGEAWQVQRFAPDEVPEGTVQAPVPLKRAVAIIQRWYGYGSPLQAREALIEARRALRTAFREKDPLTRPLYPHVQDFKIPSETTLLQPENDTEE